MMVDPPIASQMVMKISSSRALDWEHQWEKKLDIHCDIILVQDL